MICLQLLALIVSVSAATIKPHSEQYRSNANSTAIVDGKSPPSAAKTYNAWNLNVCVGYCDLTYALDPTLLYGHPAISNPPVPLDQVTYKMCNKAYLWCNQNCLATYENDMKQWPPLDTDYPVFTDSTFPNCVATCDTAAAIDNNRILNDKSGPVGPQDPMQLDFAFCAWKISACIHQCREDFNEYVLDAQQNLTMIN